MEKDFTQVMRDIDALQERLDEVFKRVNADPIYETERAIADAISDNPRYFNDDRRKELAEIFFAILDHVYDRIVKQDKKNTFCNPQIAEGYLPEMEMLMLDMMPLAWALQKQWIKPELALTYDEYIGGFSEAETLLVFDILQFFAGAFDSFRIAAADVIEYWKRLATERDTMHAETDEDKALLLSVLLAKKAALS